MKYEYDKDIGMHTIWIFKFFGLGISFVFWERLTETGIFDILAFYIHPCNSLVGISILNVAFFIRWGD